ncbi:MAG: hypothetical protein KJO93_05645 [Muriicola sp.]|nr:hypothetical protein [Muriicola sp.]NNK35494.1 hypothetical protein [Eudoraea sp.]
MENNKTTRYLKYAIGEILLVVIGILLALQINSWNQERLNRIEENEMLLKLHKEFKANKQVLINVKTVGKRTMNAGVVLMSLIGTPRNELQKHNLDSLLFETFPSNELAFASNALNNIVQNGRLNLLRDESITSLLYEWNALAEIRNTRFDKLDLWNNEVFLPYLLPYISLKEMDSNANYAWAGKSKVKPDYYPLFQKVEFENLLDNSLWLHQQVIERLEETEVLIDEIIEATQP